MNFRIVENPDPGYDLEEVKKDYLNPEIPVKEIIRKYGITPGTWLTILKHWKTEGVPMRSNHNRTKTPRYYYFNNRTKKWHVNRCIRGKQYNFGSYKTEMEAKERVKGLEATKCEGRII